jgi:hypothetical protein
MKKIITQALNFTTTLCLTICLSMALHAPLQAKVYDYTKPDKKELTDPIKEYKKWGGKTFQVHNRSTQKIYVRIGYSFAEGKFCNTCTFTGFILDPGQIGKVYKDPRCVPINMTGIFITENGAKIADIPNGIRATNMNDLGTLQWDITDKQGIIFRGHETPDGWKKNPAGYKPAECK